MKMAQSVTSFGRMNYEGVFTMEDRKPKMSAHYLRSGWAKK